MGVHFTLGTDVNGNDADLATAVRAAGAWAAMTCSDGTQDGAHTIGKTGYVYWAIPAAWDKSDTTGSGTPGYEVRFSVSAALDAAVLLAEVEIIPQPPALGVYDLCLGTINRLMLASLPDAKNEIDISADGNINDYIGSDADYQLIPVGNYITSLKVFYNEVFVGTQAACYLLEGHSPDSFGLLHVNTGETGPVNNACVVTWEKRLFYIHNTGVYMFDGTGTECVSKKIDNYFDPIDIARYIPTTRLSKIQGRFNSLRNCVEWTVSKGSTQTTNNHILVYYSQQDVDGNEMGAWFLHDYAASSLVTIQGLGLELYYHGGYVGKIYQDDTTFQDNSVDITSSLTTRGFSLDPTLGLLGMFRGIHLLVDSQTSGTLTITKSADGTTSFSSLGTVSMINTDKDHSWVEYLEPILGVSCQFKIVNTTTNIPMIIHSLYAVATPVREGFIV